VDPEVEIGLLPAGNGEGRRQLPVAGLLGSFLAEEDFAWARPLSGWRAIYSGLLAVT
jgi:hypothetical protein